jgi:hypothetical protein
LDQRDNGKVRELRDRERQRSKKRRRHMAKDRRRRRRKRKERAPRPHRDRSTLPDEVTFQIHFPPGYEHLTPDEIRAHFRRLLEERIAAIHEERQAEGRTRYMGVAAILDQSPTESSGSTFPDFGRNPTIACKNKKSRVAALIDKKAWRARYREIRAEWRKGNRDVIFPAGSYDLPQLRGAAVERAPPVVL